MPGCSGFNAGFNVIKFPHSPVKQIGVFLHQLHGLELFQGSFLGNLIFTLPALFLKMTGISDIPHIANLITQMPEVPVNNIKGDEGPGMAEVTLSAYSWTANI